MKTREEILVKAEELKDFEGNAVQEESHFILIDIAGDSDEDMFSEDGILDMLYSMSQQEADPVVSEAADIVLKFING